MSDKKAAPAEAEAPPKGKSKLLILIIVGVVLLLVLVGVGVLLLKKSAPPADGEEADEPVQHEVKPKKKEKKKDDPNAIPAYHKFEKPFVAKLISDQGDAYIQVDIQLKVLDPKIGESVKQADPEIRHKITLILMGKNASQLAGAVAVQKLSNELRVAINHILDPPPPSKKKGKAAAEPEEPADEADPEDPVQAVLFTSFIIQ